MICSETFEPSQLTYHVVSTSYLSMRCSLLPMSSLEVHAESESQTFLGSSTTQPVALVASGRGFVYLGGVALHGSDISFHVFTTFHSPFDKSSRFRNVQINVNCDIVNVVKL